MIAISPLPVYLASRVNTGQFLRPDILKDRTNQLPRHHYLYGDRVIVINVPSSIRAISKEDAKAVSRLHAYCLREKLGLKQFSAAWVYDRVVRRRSKESIEDCLRRLEKNTWQIAREKPSLPGQKLPVIAFTEVESRGWSEDYLSALYVDKQYRGKQNALSYYLMRNVLNSSRNRGKGRVSLDVSVADKRAVKFYTDLGFHVESAITVQLSGIDVVLNTMVLEGEEISKACKRCTAIIGTSHDPLHLLPKWPGVY